MTTHQLMSRVLGPPARVRPADALTEDQPSLDLPASRRLPIVRALVFFAIFVPLLFVVGLVAVGILTAQGLTDEDITASVTRLTTVAAVPAALVAYWVLVRFYERRRPAMEFTWRGLARGLPVGLVLGCACILISVGVLALLGVFLTDGFHPQPDFWWSVVRVGLVAGVVEEILFRGLLFRLLEYRVGTWLAIAVSALIFGLVHLANPLGSLMGAVGIALEAGILFAAVYAYTRNLWVGIGLHAAWNVMQGPILGITVSGAVTYQSTPPGPEILTGGPFGLEASIVPIVLLTALGVFILTDLYRHGDIVQPSWKRLR